MAIDDKYAGKFGLTKQDLDSARADKDPLAPGVQNEYAQPDVVKSAEYSSLQDKLAAAKARFAEKTSAWKNQKKKNFDRGKITEDEAAALKRLSTKEAAAVAGGARGGHLIEAKPVHIAADAETVWPKKENPVIVVGRDRPGNKESGYGGQSSTQASCIDISVGRHIAGSKTFVDPNFEKDAARLYISQKSDIDQYFGLVAGPGSPDSVARSSIGMKADSVRVIARETIRLVTLGPMKKTSHDGNITSTGGIDLVAGNRNEKPDDVQPLVKGDNLRNCIESLVDLVADLNGIVSGFLQEQMTFNGVLTTHFHNSPFFGIPTTPSATCLPTGNNVMMNLVSKTKMDLIQQKINMVDFKMKYLSSVDQENYINSKYNGTN